MICFHTFSSILLKTHMHSCLAKFYVYEISSSSSVSIFCVCEVRKLLLGCADELTRQRASLRCTGPPNMSVATYDISKIIIFSLFISTIGRNSG